MAKVKDLTAATSLVAEDWLYTIIDAVGTNGGRKITLANLEASLPAVGVNSAHAALVTGNPHNSTTDDVAEGSTNNYANTAGGQGDITGNVTVVANAAHAALVTGNPHSLDSDDLTEGSTNFFANTVSGQAAITGNTEVLASTAHITVNNNPHKMPLHFTFGERDLSYFRVRTNTFFLHAQIPFAGTAKMGVPTSITIDHTIRPGDTATTIAVEIRDLATGLIIVNVNLPAPAVEGVMDIAFDVGVLSNLPATRSNLSVYAKNDGGNLQGWISGLILNF